MPKINTTTVEHNEMLCSNLDDLAFALRALDEADEGTQIELSIKIEIPGVGKKKILLLDEVPIHVSWANETD